MKPSRVALALLACATLCAAAAAGGAPGADESLLADGRQYKGAAGSGTLHRHAAGPTFNASRLLPAFNASAAAQRLQAAARVAAKFNASALPKLNASALPKVNASALPKFNASALPKLNASALPKFNASALPKLNASALAQRINVTRVAAVLNATVAAPGARNATAGWGGFAARVQSVLGGRRALSSP